MAIPLKISNLMGEPGCCETCEHLECKNVRNTAALGCVFCNKPLRKGSDYTYADPDIASGRRNIHEGALMAHYMCAWKNHCKRVAKAQKAVR